MSCRCIYHHVRTAIILHTKKRLSEDNRLLWWTMTGSNCRHPACKAGALPAELIVHVVTRPGIEPGIPPWKGGVLTAWPTGQMVTHPRLERGTPWLKVRCSANWASESSGSSSRTRTYDRSVNSRLLYRLSYRGMYGAGNEIRTRDPRLGKAVLYRWAIPAYRTDNYYNIIINLSSRMN